MQVNFSAVLKDPYGEELPEGGGSDKPATLCHVVLAALGATLEGDQALDGKGKVRIYRLMQTAADGGTKDLSPEDVTTIRDRVAKAFPAWTVGQVFDLTEG